MMAQEPALFCLRLLRSWLVPAFALYETTALYSDFS
jgi:hypothetical protein